MQQKEQFDKLQNYVSGKIIGQADLVNRLLVALLADGHLLVEGAPGLAKTRAIQVLSRAIEGDPVPLGEGEFADCRCFGLLAHVQLLAAANARLAPPPGHDGRVRSHATSAGENANGRVHPADVLRARLGANENDSLPVALPLLRRFSREDDLAARGTW